MNKKLYYTMSMDSLLHQVQYIFSENIDYYNKKTEMDSLYSQLSNSQYVVNGTVDSWFKSYTDWLSTTSDAAVIAQIDGKYYNIV
jgi:hypothetical protein